jgi:hypothetical protein
MRPSSATHPDPLAIQTPVEKSLEGNPRFRNPAEVAGSFLRLGFTAE